METVFYGSIYNDEADDYKKIVSEQFSGCAKQAIEKKMTVVKWAFDVLVENPEKKKEIQEYVNECAKTYFPNVSKV